MVSERMRSLKMMKLQCVIGTRYNYPSRNFLCSGQHHVDHFQFIAWEENEWGEPLGHAKKRRGYPLRRRKAKLMRVTPCCKKLWSYDGASNPRLLFHDGSQILCQVHKCCSVGWASCSVCSGVMRSALEVEQSWMHLKIVRKEKKK